MKIIPYLILLCLSSCIYTDVKFPLDRDVWQTKLGTKEGVASSHSILWLVSWGDSGTKKAAENGGITVVQHMDVGFQSYFFGAYTKSDTIVYGD